MSDEYQYGLASSFRPPIRCPYFSITAPGAHASA
jgi:hypothetical protein